ncbi:hypothetical protein BH11CYA1_BH11CYA1_29600 [soil metagenome]
MMLPKVVAVLLQLAALASAAAPALAQADTRTNTRTNTTSNASSPEEPQLQMQLQLQQPLIDETKPRAPLQGNAKFEGPIETSGTLLTGRAGSAPSKVYKGWLDAAHPNFALSASAASEDSLIVITDRYDQAEHTLKSLALPFRSMDKREFDSYDLSAAKVLVIDCGPKNISFAGGMKIREFVSRGGYLITTDWMLDRLDQKIFPGYIAWNGANNSKKLYEAQIVGKDPVLFRHAVTRANWKMDIHCHLIRVINKELVRVLAISPSLAKDDPDGQGILAVVFPFEKGYVMHMTAHFDRGQSIGDQIDDPAPVIGIGLRQALAINFVVAGLSGTKL